VSISRFEGASHWHAYAWNGAGRPDDRERRTYPPTGIPEFDAKRIDNSASRIPPLVISEWLLKPAAFIEATYPIPDGRRDGYHWLRDELREHPRGPRDLEPEVQLAHAVDCMTRGADVVWAYYSRAGRYISRALIVCPRPGFDCPLDRAGGV
jgi:hypothetical protein